MSVTSEGRQYAAMGVAAGVCRMPGEKLSPA